jgi:hypothetical protein
MGMDSQIKSQTLKSFTLSKFSKGNPDDDE